MASVGGLKNVISVYFSTQQYCAECDLICAIAPTLIRI